MNSGLDALVGRACRGNEAAPPAPQSWISDKKGLATKAWAGGLFDLGLKDDAFKMVGDAVVRAKHSSFTIQLSDANPARVKAFTEEKLDADVKGYIQHFFKAGALSLNGQSVAVAPEQGAADSPPLTSVMIAI